MVALQEIHLSRIQCLDDELWLEVTIAIRPGLWNECWPRDQDAELLIFLCHGVGQMFHLSWFGLLQSPAFKLISNCLIINISYYKILLYFMRKSTKKLIYMNKNIHFWPEEIAQSAKFTIQTERPE